MNHMMFVLCSGAIQLWRERDLKLTTLSAIASSYYLVKCMKHNKSNTALLYEVIIIFSAIC